MSVPDVGANPPLSTAAVVANCRDRIYPGKAFPLDRVDAGILEIETRSKALSHLYEIEPFNCFVGILDIVFLIGRHSLAGRVDSFAAMAYGRIFRRHPIGSPTRQRRAVVGFLC